MMDDFKKQYLDSLSPKDRKYFKGLSKPERDMILQSVKKRALHDKIDELYSELEPTDDVIRVYFDTESDKMLEKKVRVLTALLNGADEEELGKDYYDILEKLDVPDGMTADLYGNVLDPHKYD